MQVIFISDVYVKALWFIHIGWCEEGDEDVSVQLGPKVNFQAHLSVFAGMMLRPYPEEFPLQDSIYVWLQNWQNPSGEETIQNSCCF